MKGHEMHQRWSACVILAIAFTIPGCLARQVARDGRELRFALLEMYTDQAFDNLVRAHQGQPFVQLAYSKLSVLDSDDVSSGLGGGSATTGVSQSADFSALPATLLRVSSFATKFPFGVKAERDRALTFHADPVTDQNWIYEEYLAFASNPTLFVCSDCQPEAPVHMSCKVGEMWYWVPAESSEAFLDLVLRTSIAVAPRNPLGYWETTITKSEKVKSDSTSNGTIYLYEAEVQDADLPNDFGTAEIIRKSGSKEWVVVMKTPSAAPESSIDSVPMLLLAPGPALVIVPPAERGGAVKEGTKPKKMKLRLQSTRELVALEDSTIRFYSANYPNVEQPKDPRQKTEDLLESIRILLTKNGSPN